MILIESLNAFLSEILPVLRTYSSTVCFAGDFNANLLTHNTGENIADCYDKIISFRLIPSITCPTRYDLVHVSPNLIGRFKTTDIMF